MIFDEQMRKMDEIIDRMEWSVVKDAHKAIDDAFNKISQQSRPKASQDKDSETKSKYGFQCLEERPDKKPENDEIDVLNIKVNDTAIPISPSNSHFNKDENDLDQDYDESQASVVDNNNDQHNDKGWIPQCAKEIKSEK